MAYFSYSNLSVLLRPSSVSGITVTNGGQTLNTLTYGNYSSTTVSPFGAEQINENFYTLACSAIDNTTRISLLESRGVYANSQTNGYIIYTGLNENQGSFYSGSPLSLYSNSFTFSCSSVSPYTLDNTHRLAVRIASAQGIVFQTGTQTINTSASNYRTLYFGDAGVGSPYTDINTMLSYMRGKLKYNSKDTYTPAMSFQVLGTGQPGNNASLLTPNTFPLKYFYLYINDGYTISSGVQCSIGGIIFGSLANIASALQSSLNTGAASLGFGSPFTVSLSNSGIGPDLLITANTDRTTPNGIYEFTLATDSVDDGTNPSVLSSSFFGFLPGSSNTVEAYDLSSFLDFGVTGFGPYTFVIKGVGSSILVSFLDGDGSSTPGIFASLMNITLPSSPSFGNGYYYHTRLPLSTYTASLNYGGNMQVNNFTCNNLTVTGNVTYSGSVSFSGIQNFGNITANGNLTVTGVTSTPGSFDGGSTIPYSTSTRINYNGTMFSTLFVGDSVGVSVPSYIYNIPINSSATPGYRIYNDNSTTTPVNGIGTGSSTVTFASTANSVLYSSFDNLITKSAISSQGQGLSYDFSIDYGITTQPMSLSFLYMTSTSYISGDMAIFLYDKTNNNFIPVSQSSIPTTNGKPSLFQASFLPSSSTAYRLIFHIASTNTAAYTLQFNAVSVAPQSFISSSSNMVSNLIPFSMVIGAVTTAPTITGNTVTNNVAQYSQSGIFMDMEFNYAQTAAGTNTAGSGNYLFYLPAGYTIDYTKYSTSGTLNSMIPVGTGRVYNGTNYYPAIAYINPSISLSAILLVYQTTIGTDVIVSSANIPLTTTSLEYHITCRVPIAQWGVPVNTASEYQRYAYNSTATTTSDMTLTGLINTNSLEGANGMQIQSFAPSGILSVTKYVSFNTPINNRDDFPIEIMNPAIPSVWPSASEWGFAYQPGTTTSYGVSVTPVNAYTVAVNFYSQANPTTTWASINNYFWRIRKRSQGNTAQQPPVVRAEYVVNTITSIPSSGNVINFDSLVEDTHSSVSSPSVNWAFTASIPGVYNVNFSGAIAARAFVAGEVWTVQLYKNGSIYTSVASHTFSTSITLTNPLVLCGSANLRLKTGESISLYISYSPSGTATWNVAGNQNIPRISIERIGS